MKIKNIFTQKNEVVLTGEVVTSNDKVVKVQLFATKSIIPCLRRSLTDEYEEGDHVLVIRNDKGSSYIVSKYDEGLYPNSSDITDI